MFREQYGWNRARATDEGVPAAAKAAKRDLYATPSFFCRLVEEVVYWNTSRLSG